MAVKKAANQGGSTAPGRHNNNSSRPHLLTLNTQTWSKKTKKHMSRFHASPPHLIQLAKLFHLLRNPVFLELQHLARFAKSNKYHEEKKFPPNRNWKSHLCHRINQGAVVGCWKIPGEKKEKEKKRWKVFPPLLGVRPVFHHFNALPAELRRGRLSRYNLWMVFRQSPHRRHLLKCHLPHNLSTDSLSIVHFYCCSQSH